MKIPETRGGHNVIYDFGAIEKYSSKFFPDAPDKIRNAASAYAKRHGIKLICRTTRDEKKRRLGITIYHQ